MAPRHRLAGAGRGDTVRVASKVGAAHPDFEAEAIHAPVEELRHHRVRQCGERNLRPGSDRKAEPERPVCGQVTDERVRNRLAGIGSVGLRFVLAVRLLPVVIFRLARLDNMLRL